MNKQEYLSALGRWLRELPEEERKKQLAYYGEMFDDMLEDGLSPAEAAARLGEPVTLAAEILSSLGRTLPLDGGGAEVPPARKRKNRTAWLVLGIVLAALLLRWGWLALVGLFTFNTVRTETESAVVTEELTYDGGKTYSLDAARVRALDVDWPDGSVTIGPGEDDKIVFTQSGAGLTADLEWKTENGTLYIQTERRFLWAGTAGHLQILLPQSLAEDLEELTVDTASAPITVQQLSARRLTLDTASGAMELTDTAAGTADLDSASGRIAYRGSAENLTADTASGAIEISLTGEGDELHLDSTSGAITAGAERLREITAETASGRIELSIADLSVLQDVEVDTVSGRVELRLPEGSGIQTDFETVSGRMTSDFAGGTRGPEVDVSTVSGNLTIRSDPELPVPAGAPEG